MEIPCEVVVDVIMELAVGAIDNVDDGSSVVVGSDSGTVKCTDKPTAIPTIANNEITKSITHFFFANLKSILR